VVEFPGTPWKARAFAVGAYQSGFASCCWVLGVWVLVLGDGSCCWVLGVWVLVLGDGSCCWAMEQKQGLGAGRRKGNPTPSLS